MGKIDEGIKLLDEKLSNRERFRATLESNPNRRSLMYRIEIIRSFGVRRIVAESGLVLQKFTELHKKKTLAARAFRDYSRIFSLVYGHALLNTFSREKENATTIKATEKDIDAAYRLYKPIMNANEAGVSPDIYGIFENVLIPSFREKNEERAAKNEGERAFDGQSANLQQKVVGISYLDGCKACFAKIKRNVSYDKMKSIYSALLSVGLLVEGDRDDNGRTNLFIPIIREGEDE